MIANTPATTLDKDRREVSHSWPQFLPDGKHFIYLALSADREKSGIYIQELGAPRRALVLENLTTQAAFAPPGYLLFVREATIYAQRLDLKKFQVKGDPMRIAEDVRTRRIGPSAFAVSASGVLAYRREAVKERQLTWYDRRGKRLNVVGKPAEYIIMRVSPDEKHVALQRKAGAGVEDTWIMDLRSGISTRTTSNLKQTYYGPVWSPDSQRIVVSLQGGGLKEIVLASAATRDLSSGPNSISANDWSRDGNLISTSGRPTQVLLLPMGPELPGSPRKLGSGSRLCWSVQCLIKADLSRK